METTHYEAAFPRQWRYYLVSPDMGTVEVEEPLEWRDVIFEFARNKETDGVVMMPSVPIKFGGKGAELIRKYVYIGWTSMTLRIERMPVFGEPEVYFEGSLSAESLVDGVDSVEIQAEDASLENRVNSKASVAYDIPFTAAERVTFRGLTVSLVLDAVNTDGVTRYKVPNGVQEAAEHPMALPVEVVKGGDPFLYDPAAPDVLIAKRAAVIKPSVTANLKPTATVSPDSDNINKTGVSGGQVTGSPYIALVVYGIDGTEKRTAKIDSSGLSTPTLWLERGDLITVEIRGAVFQTTAPASQEGDNYLNFTWGKVNASEPLVTVSLKTDHSVFGFFACLTAKDAFSTLLRAIAPDIDFNIEYQAGIGLEDYALFTTDAIAGAESGSLKASFNDFRDFFAMLGIGVAFDEKDGKPRCYVAFDTRTGETGALWPTTPSALIADVGREWEAMSLKFNEEALFGAVEIGWDGVGDYEIIPYLSDYCGKATYINGQNSTSAIKQLVSKWRADALGIADLLMQIELKGKDAVNGDDIWVLKCVEGGKLIAESERGIGLTYFKGVNLLYNLSLRPTALLNYVKPLLAVPLAFLPDIIGIDNRVYRLASSSNTPGLYVDGKLDIQPVSVASELPVYLPVYAAFSSSIRANLYKIMRNPAKRYGYLAFNYRGAALKGVIRSLRYNPTEESSQRCELYLTGDTDPDQLIK